MLLGKHQIFCCFGNVHGVIFHLLIAKSERVLRVLCHAFFFSFFDDFHFFKTRVQAADVLPMIKYFFFQMQMVVFHVTSTSPGTPTLPVQISTALTPPRRRPHRRDTPPPHMRSAARSHPATARVAAHTPPPPVPDEEGEGRPGVGRQNAGGSSVHVVRQHPQTDPEDRHEGVVWRAVPQQAAKENRKRR